MSDDLRERVARAIAKSDGYDPEDWEGEMSEGLRDDYLANADAALAEMGEPASVSVREAALIDASGELCSIVEGVQGSFNHGTWRDEKNGMRLKDTGEWARFYVALRAIAGGKE